MHWQTVVFIGLGAFLGGLCFWLGRKTEKRLFARFLPLAALGAYLLAGIAALLVRDPVLPGWALGLFHGFLGAEGLLWLGRVFSRAFPDRRVKAAAGLVALLCFAGFFAGATVYGRLIYTEKKALVDRDYQLKTENILLRLREDGSAAFATLREVGATMTDEVPFFWIVRNIDTRKEVEKGPFRASGDGAADKKIGEEYERLQNRLRKMMEQDVSKQPTGDADTRGRFTGGKSFAQCEKTGERFRVVVGWSVFPARLVLGSADFHNGLYWMGLSFGLLCAACLFATALYLKKLRREEEKRSAFLSAAAHELKTPVAVIANAAECILENVSPEKNGEYAALALEETKRMTSLLSAFLTYRGLYEKSGAQKSPVRIKAALEEAAGHYKTAAEEKGMTFVFEGDDSLTVPADPALLILALDALVSNAVTYGNAGTAVRLGWEGKGFTVEDEGPEIPKADLSRVFEALYRGDKSREAGPAGSGMGLTVAQKIFALHGWDFTLENTGAGVWARVRF